MKKVLVFALAACLLCAASVTFARSLGLPNELINGSFENGWTGWTNSGGVSLIGPGWFWGAGPHEGATAVGAASNWGVTTGEITQIVPVAAPGIYEVDLTGWAWLFDNSNDWGFDSYVLAELTVDGVVVASRKVSSMTDPMETYNPIELRWTGYVEAFKDVHIVVVGDGRGGGGWGVAATDDWDLEERLVPEPSSLLALLTGAAALGGLALRRR